MKNLVPTRLFFFSVLIFGLSAVCFGQNELLKRTTYKTDKVEFGVGGTLSIIGAPNGSIEVEGWNKSEIGISAEIVVQAGNESDLALLASVVGFMTDIGYAHTRIVSVGPNDKKYLKTVAKKFPKHLMTMPFRIDYKIMVPAFCDLEIDGGNGDITLSKVEGTMRVKALETNAKLDLVGGTMVANFGKGNVDVTIPKSSWRGRNVDIQLVFGTMNVSLPKNLNAELDAQVLRTGQIENDLKNLKKRARAEFTDKMISAKSGGGGANLNFIVGDGTLKLTQSEKPL
jgi:hypothetical protein